MTDCSTVDDAHAARRRYKKDIDHIKPDLVAYNKQKEMALGMAPGSLMTFDPKAGSSQVCRPLGVSVTFSYIICSLSRLVRNSNNLRPRTCIGTPTHSYMETTSPPKRLLTGWSARSIKSSSYFWLSWISMLTCNVDSIDKKGKFSRKRLNEEEGDITYINEHNRVFNKKVGFVGVPVEMIVLLSALSLRLHGITTSIPQRSVQVSSAARHCRRSLRCVRLADILAMITHE